MNEPVFRSLAYQNREANIKKPKTAVERNVIKSVKD